MILLQSAAIEKPHISAKELAKYPLLTPARRLTMLREHKFKNEYRAGYYSAAEHAIRRSLVGNLFDEAKLLSELDKIQAKNSTSKTLRDKALNNLEMVRRFMGLRALAAPMPGVQSKPRSASMELDGVTVSIRPELLTESHETRSFSFIKFYFFKGEISADAADLLLLLLIKYGLDCPRAGLSFDLQNTKVIDCYGRNVILGHHVPRSCDQKLTEALKDINRLWPTIRPKQNTSYRYDGPGG